MDRKDAKDESPKKDNSYYKTKFEELQKNLKALQEDFKQAMLKMDEVEAELLAERDVYLASVAKLEKPSGEKR